MKKISQGKYELFTTKADAIDKFMQMQGACREQISDEHAINFYCSKKGKIIITNPPRRHGKRVSYRNSTNLFAKITEQDGKTYVTYYTAFSKSNNVLKIIFLIMDIIMAVWCIMLVIASAEKTYYLLLFLIALVGLGYSLYVTAKEEYNSPNDSQVMIKELEKRVDAVNLWDK